MGLSSCGHGHRENFIRWIYTAVVTTSENKIYGLTNDALPDKYLEVVDNATLSGSRTNKRGCKKRNIRVSKGQKSNS